MHRRRAARPSGTPAALALLTLVVTLSVTAGACSGDDDGGDGRPPGSTAASTTEPRAPGREDTTVSSAPATPAPTTPTTAGIQPAPTTRPLTDEPRAFLEAFLATWWARDFAGLERFADEAVLASFQEEPQGWAGYRLDWTDDCALDASGAGMCAFSLLTAEGSGFTYEVRYGRAGDTLRLTAIDPTTEA